MTSHDLAVVPNQADHHGGSDDRAPMGHSAVIEPEAEPIVGQCGPINPLGMDDFLSRNAFAIDPTDGCQPLPHPAPALALNRWHPRLFNAGGNDRIPGAKDRLEMTNKRCGIMRRTVHSAAPNQGRIETMKRTILLATVATIATLTTSACEVRFGMPTGGMIQIDHALPAPIRAGIDKWCTGRPINCYKLTSTQFRLALDASGPAARLCAHEAAGNLDDLQKCLAKRQ